VIKLTELFSGTHPALDQAYHPMVIRFFILQTHYRSTLDFSNEALKAAEKGLKRLWEGYENLNRIAVSESEPQDKELDTRVRTLVGEFEAFINDDFNTAKVMANMFELVPIINSIKDKHISGNALGGATVQLLRDKMHLFVEDIFGLQNIQEQTDGKIDGIIRLLMDIRTEARKRKDFLTSDKIRNQLAALGVQLKDEKDGSMSYTFL
jgi:cysteinyl-tRNA synthetase